MPKIEFVKGRVNCVLVVTHAPMHHHGKRFHLYDLKLAVMPKRNIFRLIPNNDAMID